jgi:hypothetical protein
VIDTQNPLHQIKDWKEFIIITISGRIILSIALLIIHIDLMLGCVWPVVANKR